MSHKPQSVREPFVTGGWLVDPARCMLEGSGGAIRLEPKVMDVMVYLAQRARAVVSKEDLIRDVWEGRYVSEDVITVSIHELRKALGDNAKQPEFIETIPRRGYRWIAGVTAPTAAGSPAPRSRPAWRFRVGLAAALLVVFVLAGTWARWRTSARASAGDEKTLAQAAYAKGRFFLNGRSPAGFTRALSYFEEAVRLDGNFAAPHAGIALTAVHMMDAGSPDRSALARRARAEVARALTLHRDSPEALTAQGMIHLVLEWNFTEAEKDFQRAVERNPALMDAHQGYSWLLSATGRHPEANAEAQRARNLDPTTTMRYIELAWTYSYSGRYREAVTETEKALELDPRDFQSYLTKGMVLELMGNAPAAYAAIRQGYQSRPDGARMIGELDATYQREGLRGIYRNWLKQMESPDRRQMRNEVWLASLYSRVGEIDRAIAALEEAYTKHEGGLAWLRVNPSFMPLRYDARYQSLVQRVGLAN